jgi:hypothetical protein
MVTIMAALCLLGQCQLYELDKVPLDDCEKVLAQGERIAKEAFKRLHPLDRPSTSIQLVCTVDGKDV